MVLGGHLSSPFLFMIKTNRIPTNAELREKALQNTPYHNIKGQQGEYLADVLERFLEYQYYWLPAFCEHTRIVNAQRRKYLEDYGNKTSTKMVGGKVTDGTTGWNSSKTLKEFWVIPNQLKFFMHHIDPNFWDDSNKLVRNSFMKGVLRGDDSYSLLNKVYTYYGKNLSHIS